ncbi:MAG: helix-turn-helix domain-containing protein [Acidobacteriaceae bacterium]
MGKDKKHKKVKKGDHAAIATEPVAVTKSEPKSTTKTLEKSSAKPQEKLSTKPEEKTPKKSQEKIDALVREIIERIADKWTMVVLDVLAEHGTVRFTQLGKLAGSVSQKMLTKTVRQMESDGLVKRTIHPVVPPRVEYALTPLGRTLGEAFCGVWLWAEKNYDAIEHSRATFRHKP